MGSSLAAEALRARQLWGADQGSFKAALRAEIERRHPHLAGQSPDLESLPPLERLSIIQNVAERRKEAMRWEQVGEASVALTPRLLKAAEVIGRSEPLECWYLYDPSQPCQDGQRQKMCHLVGPSLVV